MTTQAAGRDTVGIPAVAVRRTTGEWLAWLAGRAGLHLSLVILTLIWLVPTVGLLITSLRPKGDILGSGWWTILAHPDLTLANYTNVIVSKGMGQAFFNSIAITVPATVLPVLLAALAAFAFAWIPFPGRDALFLGVIALLVIPIQMTCWVRPTAPTPRTLPASSESVGTLDITTSATRVVFSSSTPLMMVCP